MRKRRAPRQLLVRVAEVHRVAVALLVADPNGPVEGRRRVAGLDGLDDLARRVRGDGDAEALALRGVTRGPVDGGFQRGAHRAAFAADAGQVFGVGLEHFQTLPQLTGSMAELIIE